MSAQHVIRFRPEPDVQRGGVDRRQCGTTLPFRSGLNIDIEQWFMPDRFMRRYWITFDQPSKDEPVLWIGLGVGVTAPCFEGALKIIQLQIFAGEDLPAVNNCIVDIDVSTLDADHVLPNMGVPASHGIWFPLGFAQPTI